MNIGDVVEKWTLLKEERRDKRIAWLARCECGKERVVMQKYLLNGRSTSCGCSKRGKHHITTQATIGSCIARCIYNKGDVVGDLEILDKIYRHGDESNKNRCYYIVKCICGNIKEIRADIINRIKNQNCGCRKIPNHSKYEDRNILNSTEIKTWDRIYHIYYDMIARCTREKYQSYKNYGGRGISVCEEWLHSFSVFYKWSLLNGYSDNLTIDRIDNNGNYCPENCQWIAKKENSRKTRKVKLSIEIANKIKERIKNGEKQCDLAIEYGVRDGQISRIKHGTRWIE